MKKQRNLLSLSQLVKTPERAFLTLALIFGALFLVALPPFQSPDEPAHFYRAYQLSDGKIIADVLAEKKAYSAGGTVPSSLVKTASIWLERIPGNPGSQKVKGEQFSKTWNLPLRRQKTTQVAFGSAPYSPIPYLPQVIGVSVGKILNLSPLWLFYLGRFANFIVATLITFFAIKIVPSYKWVFFLLALTPIAIAQRVSLSADALLNATAFLLIAVVVNCAFNLKKQEVLDQDVLLISLGNLAVALSKTAYLPLGLLFFLIPKHKFSTYKKYWLSCLFAILPSILAWFLWSVAVKHLGAPVYTTAGASPQGQIEYLRTHPLTIFSTAWNSLQNIEPILNSFIGVLGWLDTRVPTITILSYQLMLVLVALVSRDPDFVVSRSSKLKITFVLAAIVFPIYLLMYVLWSPVGAVEVSGVQGRYFIPTSPLFFLLLYNQYFWLKISEKAFRSVVIYYSVFALLSSLIATAARYY